MKLSDTQKAALATLTDEWKSSYDLQINRRTLQSLVRIGLVENKFHIGSIFSPGTCIFYRKKER